jgi:hypothetical protein
LLAKTAAALTEELFSRGTFFITPPSIATYYVELGDIGRLANAVDMAINFSKLNFCFIWLLFAEDYLSNQYIGDQQGPNIND